MYDAIRIAHLQKKCPRFSDSHCGLACDASARDAKSLAMWVERCEPLRRGGCKIKAIMLASGGKQGPRKIALNICLMPTKPNMERCHTENTKRRSMNQRGLECVQTRRAPFQKTVATGKPSNCFPSSRAMQLRKVKPLAWVGHAMCRVVCPCRFPLVGLSLPCHHPCVCHGLCPGTSGVSSWRLLKADLKIEGANATTNTWLEPQPVWTFAKHSPSGRYLS